MMQRCGIRGRSWSEYGRKGQVSARMDSPGELSFVSEHDSDSDSDSSDSWCFSDITRSCYFASRSREILDAKAPGPRDDSIPAKGDFVEQTRRFDVTAERLHGQGCV
ncbi:hypothetical protein ANANG_G00114920 [Anguilla anguilla]|uniref:Uncharacterized protein n=1 Tax=Anguilla anguilla TaxID=7936 RepID=A0A9D3RX45_ANGAN|nr:hypothetical protein ANANG_G00114920 [Anguilla anguilla]